MNCFKIHHKYVSSLTLGTEYKSNTADRISLFTASVSSFSSVAGRVNALSHLKSHYYRTIHTSMGHTWQNYILRSSLTLFFPQCKCSSCLSFSSQDPSS